MTPPDPGPGIYHWLSYADDWINAPEPNPLYHSSPFWVPHTWVAGGTYWYYLDPTSGTFTMQDGDPLSAYWPIPATYTIPILFCTQYKGSATFLVELEIPRVPDGATGVWQSLGSYTLNSDTWAHLAGDPVPFVENLAYDNANGFYDLLRITVSSGSIDVYQAAVVERCGAARARVQVSGRLGPRQATFQQ